MELKHLHYDLQCPYMSQPLKRAGGADGMV